MTVPAGGRTAMNRLLRRIAQAVSLWVWKFEEALDVFEEEL
jgi:hypothetical protein